jgi:hypothetical protein
MKNVIPKQTIGRRKADPRVNRVAPLRKTFLNQAIQDRAILISEEVSDDIKEQIKDHVRVYYGIAPAASYRMGTDKINLTELRERVRQSIEGGPDFPGASFGQRAKVIGKTEAIGAETLGRLYAWKDLANSGSPYRVRKVRYQTYEWRSAIPGTRPCLYCLPKNGAVLDLTRDWQLIMTKYLIPAHGNCHCRWLPILEDSRDESTLIADPTRQPDSGAKFDPKWVGWTLAKEGVEAVVGEGVGAMIRKRMEVAQRKKRRQQLMKGAVAAASVLTFGSLLYTFFQYWNQQDVRANTGGNIIQPNQLRQAAIDAIQEQGGSIAQDAANDLITKALSPAEFPLRRLLTPDRVQRIIDDLPSEAIAQDKISLDYLKGLGYTEEDARRIKMAIGQMRDDTLNINGIDLQRASVKELLDSGMFGKKEAQAIAAYRQSNLIRSWKDLEQILRDDGKRMFADSQINRLMLRGFSLNLNKPNLTIEELMSFTRIKRPFAEKVMRARGLKPIADAEDFIDRLAGVMIADGAKSPSNARSYARQFVKKHMQVEKDGTGFLRIDPIGPQGDPLPNLESLERVDRRVGPISATTTPMAAAAPLPPPETGVLPDISQTSSLSPEQLDALRKMPASIRRRYSRLIKDLDKSAGKTVVEIVDGKRVTLEKLIDAEIKNSAEQVRAANDYLAISGRLQQLGDRAVALSQQIDQTILDLRNGRIDAGTANQRIVQLNDLLRNAKEADKAAGSYRQVTVNGIDRNIQTWVEQYEVLRDRTVPDNLRNVMVGDPDGSASLSYGRINNELVKLQEQMADAPESERAVLEEQVRQLQSKMMNFDDSALVQKVQAQIDILTSASSSLRQASTAIAGDRARVQGIANELEQKKADLEQEMRASIERMRQQQQPAQEAPTRRRKVIPEVPGLSRDVVDAYMKFREVERIPEAQRSGPKKRSFDRRQEKLQQLIQSSGMEYAEIIARLRSLEGSGYLNFRRNSQVVEFVKSFRPKVLGFR